ncbi:TrbI/VirB10 family protein [Sphingobium xenophagum]|uniref:Conjugal transfer pilus assembly protein TraB n=1 Tax=Sphingobium xenophagum TaxID=121428 RepID=A0A401IWQ6_SPHXE|nr:TrbI/VirB10 family protein [Sphingobium xenophagum]GBH28789.1 conjugal transfer pilus assembly protein TraB [Sphingobium xenophagum]
MAHETERSGGEPAADNGQVAATPESRREVGRRNLNRQIAQRQKALLIGVGALALVGGATFLFSGDNGKGSGASGEAVTIDTGGLVNRNLSEREFVATYGNRADAQDREIKALKEGQVSRPELEQQLAALKTENAQMRTDGQHAIDAISAENAALKTQLDQASRAPAAPVMPPPVYGPGVTPGAGTPTPGANRQGPDGPPADAKVSLMSFETGDAGPKKPAGDTAAPQLLLQDSPDYLPPNSYAPARVIVGVDASTGVASQTDPLPVVLRITGPARSVMRGGKVLTTDITGCLVNGAARGDLSSEKVYVKLARMTCAQPGGRYAVSEVKGFISFAGKSGVRGRVVSREGSLVGQALLAGIVGGFGRGFSANANGIFTGQIGADGKRQALSPTDIVTGGIGQGAGEAADTVSKYLIERAEQYQPVVEMPTGIEVEIVFLDGVHVRSNTK